MRVAAIYDIHGNLRSGNHVPIGSYLGPTFNFGIRPTIWRKLLSASEP